MKFVIPFPSTALNVSNKLMVQLVTSTSGHLLKLLVVPNDEQLLWIVDWHWPKDCKNIKHKKDKLYVKKYKYR